MSHATQKLKWVLARGWILALCCTVWIRILSPLLPCNHTLFLSLLPYLFLFFSYSTILKQHKRACICHDAVSHQKRKARPQVVKWGLEMLSIWQEPKYSKAQLWQNLLEKSYCVLYFEIRYFRNHLRWSFWNRRQYKRDFFFYTETRLLLAGFRFHRG